MSTVKQLGEIIGILLEGKDPQLVGVSISQPVDWVFASDEDADLDPDMRKTKKVAIEDQVSYNWLKWESETYPKPTEDEFNAAVLAASSLAYREQRREAYPSIADQLDMLYHEGFDGWRTTIEAVKQQFPKPE